MRHTNTLRAALEGVIKVADRDTDEFNAARAALAATAAPEQSTPEAAIPETSSGVSSDFMSLCKLLPADTSWGEPLTPHIVREIRSALAEPAQSTEPVAGSKFGSPEMCALILANLAAREAPAQSTEPVAITRYMLSCNGELEPNELGDYIKYSDLTAQLAAMTAKYQELIYQVGKKYPGESRHQTALRYIGQAEQDHTDYSVAAIAATKGDKSD